MSYEELGVSPGDFSQNGSISAVQRVSSFAEADFSLGEFA
jgi:hypothetical protein